MNQDLITIRQSLITLGQEIVNFRGTQVALAKSKMQEYPCAYQRIQAVFAKHCLG